MQYALLFDRRALYETLDAMGLDQWAKLLRSQCAERLTPALHGKMPSWIAAWESLPAATHTAWSAAGPAVSVSGLSPFEPEALNELLKTFHPWRKGPFDLFGVAIDCEWRSDLKWNRIARAVDFQGRRVVDVGCGNGYYGWRMLAAGAELVVGCDPFALYLMQYEVLRRYAPRPERHFVLPLIDEELPENLAAFDIALSMGVLYHRPQPLQHLSKMLQTLVPGGRLVLETLIIDSRKEEALTPPGRYAKMKNIGLIPSLPLLSRWLSDIGFVNIQTIDITRTTDSEQRRTDWMTFESLNDFLDPDDRDLTVEGHPAPLRAIVTAQRPS